MSSSTKQVTAGREQHIRYPFWFGGSSACFAACVTHPLDLVKVRLQTQPQGESRNMLQMFRLIVGDEGVRGVYRGLSASLMRQLTYSTTRFGAYEKLKEAYTTPGSVPSFLHLVVMASGAGFAGGLAGNPADVLNVRMQHDAALPADKRRNYKHAIDGLVRMTREEGAASLFKGVWPNSVRASLMTASQLASYDVFKRMLLKATSLKDSLTTHFTASLMAGFVATTICSPVDVIKTRVMSATEHKSLPRLLADIYRAEGLRWVFKGWVPSFVRLGPQTIFTFLFLEQHKKLYRQLRA